MPGRRDMPPVLELLELGTEEVRLRRCATPRCGGLLFGLVGDRCRECATLDAAARDNGSDGVGSPR